MTKAKHRKAKFREENVAMLKVSFFGPFRGIMLLLLTKSINMLLEGALTIYGYCLVKSQSVRSHSDYLKIAKILVIKQLI
jgi:hypothetical protein